MRILVFQHVAIEHPGIFREFWDDAGHAWKAVELDEGDPIPSFDGFDLLVVMGGPMDVWQEEQYPWLRAEKMAIRRWVVELGRPFFGVCLGHQLLAEALGGKVGLMSRPEVGLAIVDLTPKGRADPLLSGFSVQVETFQWHGAEVTRVPEFADVLASNAACPIQMLRCGSHAYGLQYHCEITASTVNEWASIPAYRKSLESALGVEGSSRLPERVAPRLPSFRQAAQLLNGNLMALVRGGATSR